MQEITEESLKEEAALGKGLNKEILGKLKYRIYFMERDNSNTKKLSDPEMVDKIRRLIMQEVDRDDN